MASRSLIATFRFCSEHRRAAEPTHRRRPLLVETLEPRRLLTGSNLGQVFGTVFEDADMSGGLDVGEELSGVLVQLFADNGDGVLQEATDAIVASSTTGNDGSYVFEGLSVGNYFVLQPAQTANRRQLERQSALVTVEVLRSTVIDTFDTDAGPTIATFPSPLTVSSVHRAMEALGGQRDFEVTLTAGNAGDQIMLDTSGGILKLNPDLSARGTYRVVWDNADAVSDGLSPSGLGGVDLVGTTLNRPGICLSQLRFDQPGGNVRIRVYSDASNWSEAEIENLAPLQNQNLFVPFGNARRTTKLRRGCWQRGRFYQRRRD